LDETHRPHRADGPPRVWLLMGHRTGDNSQVLALGEALGWPLEIKRFVYTSWERLVNLPISSSLAGVDKRRSCRLEPPWPDLVISAGRRNEPIARWIRKQARGDVRLVHVGRPWAALESWDLVVTTPQYRLPALPNVLHNETPLHRVTPQRLAEAAAAWRPRIAHLPGPHISVLAGGNSGPYPFDRVSGERLAHQASAFASARNGSLLVTTSARTPAATAEALFAGIRCPAFLYRWTSAAAENPYYALLGLADRLIVTADSISMMTEACATGRPVYLFDTGVGRTSMRERSGAEHEPLRERVSRAHFKAFVYRQTMRYGPMRWTRDIRIIQRRLVDSGRAVWLGEGDPAGAPPPLEDVPRAVARVRSLFEPAAQPRLADPERYGVQVA
jgi:mitochondrial fission protein ELM1